MSDIIVMMLVAAVLLMLLIPTGIRKRKGEDEVRRHVPRGPATGLELVCWGLREMVARPLLGPHTDRFIGFIWTIFFFILTVNMLGILPLGSSERPPRACPTSAARRPATSGSTARSPWSPWC